MASEGGVRTRVVTVGLAVLLLLGALVATVRYATADREGKSAAADPGLQSLLVGRELWWARTSLRTAGVRVETSSVDSGRATLWARVLSLGAIHERAGRRVVHLEIRPGVRPPLQVNDRAARSRCLTARPKTRPFYDRPLFGGPRVFLGGFLERGALTYLSPGRAGGAFLQIVVPGPVPSGPLLVRGQPVGRSGEIRFEQRAIRGTDRIPLVGTPHELHLPADRGLRVWSFILHFPAPGCYALQVDGRTFSQMIAFRAARARPPRLARAGR
ncbi:hypothetical protein BH18ACT15_BH18ACT15_03660 [soil metagenome]